MSASDAAPLPRLGEVFFDVRGHSRSMRLSWYADTGIAVFSIWQGGRCTGTFRLPIDDLARMTEILQRGPQRRPGGARPGHERGDYEGAGYAGAGYEGHQYDDAGYAEHRHDDAAYDEHHYGDSQYDEASHGEHRYNEPSYGEHRYDERSYDEPSYDEPSYDEHSYDERNRAGGQGTDEYGAGEHGLTGGYADRPGANRAPADYADSAGYERSGGYADSAASAGASEATGRYEFPTRAVRREDGGYLRPAGDQDDGVVTDLSGYGHQRFVPPYVRSGGEAYPNDNPAAGSARRARAAGPAYPADRAADSADPDDYWKPSQPEAGYSGGSEYRTAADPAATAQYSAGRHSGRRARSSGPAPLGEPELGAPDGPFSERDYWSEQPR